VGEVTLVHSAGHVLSTDRVNVIATVDIGAGRKEFAGVGWMVLVAHLTIGTIWPELTPEYDP